MRDKATLAGCSGYVLVAEDDAAIGRLLETIISESGLPVRVARTGHEALAHAEKDPPAVLVLDLGLPGLYGTSVAVTLKRTYPKLPIVVISAMPTDVVVQDSWSIGAYAYFTKPFECDDVVRKVHSAWQISEPKLACRAKEKLDIPSTAA